LSAIICDAKKPHPSKTLPGAFFYSTAISLICAALHIDFRVKFQRKIAENSPCATCATRFFCDRHQILMGVQIDFTLPGLVFKLPIISIHKINRRAKWIELNRFTGLAQQRKARHNGK